MMRRGVVSAACGVFVCVLASWSCGTTPEDTPVAAPVLAFGKVVAHVQTSCKDGDPAHPPEGDTTFDDTTLDLADGELHVAEHERSGCLVSRLCDEAAMSDPGTRVRARVAAREAAGEGAQVAHEVRLDAAVERRCGDYVYGSAAMASAVYTTNVRLPDARVSYRVSARVLSNRDLGDACVLSVGPRFGERVGYGASLVLDATFSGGSELLITLECSRLPDQAHAFASVSCQSYVCDPFSASPPIDGPSLRLWLRAEACEGTCPTDVPAEDAPPLAALGNALACGGPCAPTLVAPLDGLDREGGALAIDREAAGYAWIATSSAIVRVPKSGGEVEPLAQLDGRARALTLVPGGAVWAVDATARSPAELVRFDAATGAVSRLTACDADEAFGGLATLADGTLFAACGSRVVNTSPVAGGVGLRRPLAVGRPIAAVAAYGSTLVVVTAAPHEVLRFDEGAETAVSLWTGISSGPALALASSLGDVLWAISEPYAAHGAIRRATLVGTGRAWDVAGDLGVVRGITADDAMLYFTEAASAGQEGWVQRGRADGFSAWRPETLAIGGRPGAIATDADAVYWLDADRGLVRLAK